MEPFKIFISSVMRRSIEDLSAEREAARQGIECLPMACAWAFESEPASTKPLRDSYIDEVKTCDVLLLIVGRVLTPATRDEYDTARDYQKPVLVFCKDVPEREYEVTQLLAALDSKYAPFSDAADLLGKVRDAIAQEILRRAKGYPPTDYRIGALLASLRNMARSRQTIRISPLVPIHKHDMFSLTSVENQTVSVEMQSNQQSLEIPATRIEDVMVAAPPIVVLNGRLQWITIPQRWRFFPEKPPSPDPLGVGFGKCSGLHGQTVEMIYSRIRSSGLKHVWARTDRLPEDVVAGRDVFYDDDGCYLTTARGDLVLAVRKA